MKLYELAKEINPYWKHGYKVLLSSDHGPIDLEAVNIDEKRRTVTFL